jgi:hypothetical protein
MKDVGLWCVILLVVLRPLCVRVYVCVCVCMCAHAQFVGF